MSNMPINGVTPIIMHEYYTPQMCKDNPSLLFVYGDNLLRRGKAGQACIRDEPNTFGIATKVWPSTTRGSYFSDSNEAHSFHMVNDIHKLHALLRSPDHTYTHVVFPAAGLGTGLSQLPSRAPRTYEMLKHELLTMFGVEL